MGIIGFGHIGEHVALRAGTFGVSCHAVTLHPGKPIEPGLLSAPPGRIDGGRDVDALVASSDAVVVACEHSPLTHGLVDARRLGMMRRSAVLINVARGPIVDEGALFDALERKLIAGAAIDVWYRYPENRASKVTPSTYPFERLDNVLMTPHSSGWTPGAKERKVAFLAKTINDWYASHAVGKV